MGNIMGSRTTLVTGATGAQGSAVVDAFLAGGWNVRALVRSPDRADAQVLVKRGVMLAAGEFDDRGSLDRACQGVDAVFSVQLAMGSPAGNEVVQARNLADAARAAGVPTMIHTSVSATGWRAGRPPEDAADSKLYWDCKEAVEALMLASGFETLTILKPAFMMENFLSPKVEHMFPDLKDRLIAIAIPLDRPFALIATQDIGAAAFAAATRPDDFNGRSVELAGDAGTIADYGRIIGDAIGASVSVAYYPPDQLIARGQFPGWVESQSWSARIGYSARPEHQQAFGLTPTSFATWAQANAAGLRKAAGLG